jgi:hypothetical protein
MSQMTLPFPGAERAKHMGELRRGGEHWDVFLESQPDAQLGALRGRLHFVSSGRHRVTGWIFLEWQEREVHERFGELSAVELWHFLESLPDGGVS